LILSPNYLPTIIFFKALETLDGYALTAYELCPGGVFRQRAAPPILDSQAL
jgi:hypothetical protein